MEVAEQNANGEVGVAVFIDPVLDVVRFGPGGWFVTVHPAAPIVAGSQRGALCRGEEALFASEVDRLTRGTELHGDVAGAEVPFNRRKRNRDTVDMTEPARCA
ncbi:hypothetical protein GCM10027056_09520 [Glaciibacter psychrotolerans]